MATPALVCATVEVALNRYLRLERSALDECAKLDGKSIALHVADLGWTFVIEPNAGGVRVIGEIPGTADVRVSAPTPKLLRLGVGTLSGGSKGLPAGLEVEGDTELLMRFNAILARVGFDPEELAAKLVGDAAAHRLVGGLKNLFGWGRHAADRFSQDAAEYLVEETEDLARAADVEDWMNQVDALREGVDRFDARLALLEQRQTGHGTGHADA
jgi:ubiquinone biosynthesis protein UbiJ